MTILVALHDPKGKCTWIGSDRRIVFGSIIKDHDLKWLVSDDDDRAISMCGGARGFHLIKRNEKAIWSCRDVWAVSDLLRELIRGDDWKVSEGDGSQVYDMSAIWATNAGVVMICSDFTVIEIPPDTFHADGGGSEIGYGVAYALRGRPAEKIVRTAIGAAVKHHSGCGGEPWVHQLRTA